MFILFMSIWVISLAISLNLKSGSFCSLEKTNECLYICIAYLMGGYMLYRYMAGIFNKARKYKIILVYVHVCVRERKEHGETHKMCVSGASGNTTARQQMLTKE
jgi:hypothetical protein